MVYSPRTIVVLMRLSKQTYGTLSCSNGLETIESRNLVAEERQGEDIKLCMGLVEAPSSAGP